MTLPNQLTVFRILLIPVFVLLLVYDQRVSALIVFLLTGISDSLDGFIARTWKLETTLGSILDPIADKLLIVTAFITLTVLEAVPFPLAALLVTRDVVLSLVFGIVLCMTGRRLSAPTGLGKATIVAQMCTVVLGLVFYVFDDRSLLQSLRPFLLTPVFIITAILAIVSGLHYLYQVARLFTVIEEPIKPQRTLL
ncbi:MAG: CDP-diacylglycerol--glycerol-3-phosphate 3-phosphatidyltransferase [Nitrospinae bacterium]|nr:CDP-diacylglycerol--glycerol-3-phosphate 3-phosphatidyltransferase [Nitrospinota bacterium]